MLSPPWQMSDWMRRQLGVQDEPVKPPRHPAIVAAVVGIGAIGMTVISVFIYRKRHDPYLHLR